MARNSINSYGRGFRDGIPIGLGYLSVSFAFGIMAVEKGLPIWSAVLISLTNLTSAGQLAGVFLISTYAPILETIMTQLVINIRYALMSISISQKADETMTTKHRMLSSFFITDEIFAVACGKKEDIGRRYMYGLGTAPLAGWVLGTFLGAVAGNIMPNSIRMAMGIAIYGMFIAIVVPVAKDKSAVAWVVLIAIALSCFLRYAPMVKGVSTGLGIMICAVAAAIVGATFFPIKEE